jgi:DNA-binding transcriptional LysR family regulator
MNLRELEIFRAIIRGGSITEAARLLGISQPAVSTALRHAEDQLGMQLFFRERGRIHPTPEALSLFPEVEILFEKFGAIQRYADDLRNAHSGLISVATTPTLSYTYVVEAVQQFQRRRPNVRLMLDVTHTHRIIELATSRQVDLGLIFTPSQHPGVRIEELGTTELVCIMRVDHPLAELSYVRPADIRKFPLITNSRNPLFHRVEQAFHRCGVELDFTIAVNHTVTSHLLVDGSEDAVALVDPWVNPDLFPGLIRKRFRPRIEIRPRIVTSQEHPPTRLAQLFMENLREVAAKFLA